MSLAASLVMAAALMVQGATHAQAYGNIGMQEAEALPEARRTAERPPPGAARQFRTDFSKHTVPYKEIVSGGPPKDGIPALHRPRFVRIEEADSWIHPREPVIVLEIGRDARAYPIQILIWHEIVNDTVGGRPVLITFCPLCNTAIAFERSVQGRVLGFGTTGRLRFSNLIMYDAQTESWWQQATGEAIAGDLSGSRLVRVPASLVSWSDFKASHPDGRVLSRDTGYARPYGRNPYPGYDDVRRSPFAYRGPRTPGPLRAMDRVLVVELNGGAVVYPYDLLQDERVINDTVGGVPVVVFWTPGTASALDAATIAAGRDVGSAGAYASKVGGLTLTFFQEGGPMIDRQTGSEWGATGRAVSGAMSGQTLERLPAIETFWFAWAAFRPETRIHRPGTGREDGRRP